MRDNGGNVTIGRCRFCDAGLRHTFVDLGMSPLCESYVSAEGLNQMEPFYPLHVYVCDSCFLVQLEQYVSVEHIFSEYAYFSSYADSWLAHAKNYTDMIVDRLALSRTVRYSNLPATTAICCSISCKKVCRRSA